jgi:hypothetical protein
LPATESETDIRGSCHGKTVALLYRPMHRLEYSV